MYLRQILPYPQGVFPPPPRKFPTESVFVFYEPNYISDIYQTNSDGDAYPLIDQDMSCSPACNNHEGCILVLDPHDMQHMRDIMAGSLDEIKTNWPKHIPDSGVVQVDKDTFRMLPRNTLFKDGTQWQFYRPSNSGEYSAAYPLFPPSWEDAVLIPDGMEYSSWTKFSDGHYHSTGPISDTEWDFDVNCDVDEDEPVIVMAPYTMQLLIGILEHFISLNQPIRTINKRQNHEKSFL